MVRGLLGISWLLATAGCVALNSGYQESGGQGGESSDTDAASAGPGASASKGGSAVTTVTAGDSSSGEDSDPTDSAGSSGPDSGQSGSGPDSGPSAGESSSGGDTGADSGQVDCKPLGGVDVTQDAFLLACLDFCGESNFGQTEFFALVEADQVGVFLLRIPKTMGQADRVDVTVTVEAQGSVADAGFMLSASAIAPPCNWSEGPHDDAVLMFGESGVTYDLCEGDPQMGSPWGKPGADVWDNVDEEWTLAEVDVSAADFEKGEQFPVTLSLTRDGPGPAPHSILISADVGDPQELFVYASESASPPHVDIYPVCN